MDINAVPGYRLLQRIGEGAAGEVYLATPTSDKSFAKPGEPLAIKIYRPEILRQTKQLDRIRREFLVGSQHAHPNLVLIHDCSIDDRSRPPHLVMEYVDGIRLDTWLQMFHPLPRNLLLRIVDQLLDALSHLHATGITHRDFKPANIMVSSTFDAKVMDFGVVRVTHDSPITPKDKFVGTIRNSSPEMLFGRDYDHRTDLYSLGTVLYPLLYGEEVFAEESQFARLIDLVKDTYPELDPSVASRDDVSSALFELTKQLLRKTPIERPVDVEDVRRRLTPVRASLVPELDYEPLHGYVATALTGLLPDAREAIAFVSSRIAEVAKDHGIYVYQPRKATDPLLHPDVDAAAVYLLDRHRVVSADVIFFLANQPSFGVGQELEIAATYSKPTILLVREGTTLSRMVTGSFANLLDELVYKTPEDLVRKLKRSLSRHSSTIRQFKATTPPSPQARLGHSLLSARTAAGYQSPEELAAALGISTKIILAIERGDYDNVGVHLLARLCRALNLSLHALFDPSTPADSRRRTDPNLVRLERLARRLSWNSTDYLDLRDDYLRQVAASGESSEFTDEQWRTRRTAQEQRRLKDIQDSSQQDSSQGTLL